MPIISNIIHHCASASLWLSPSCLKTRKLTVRSNTSRNLAFATFLQTWTSEHPPCQLPACDDTASAVSSGSKQERNSKKAKTGACILPSRHCERHVAGNYKVEIPKVRVYDPWWFVSLREWDSSPPSSCIRASQEYEVHNNLAGKCINTRFWLRLESRWEKSQRFAGSGGVWAELFRATSGWDWRLGSDITSVALQLAKEHLYCLLEKRPPLDNETYSMLKNKDPKKTAGVTGTDLDPWQGVKCVTELDSSQTENKSTYFYSRQANFVEMWGVCLTAVTGGGAFSPQSIWSGATVKTQVSLPDPPGVSG